MIDALHRNLFEKNVTKKTERLNKVKTIDALKHFIEQTSNS